MSRVRRPWRRREHADVWICELDCTNTAEHICLLAPDDLIRLCAEHADDYAVVTTVKRYRGRP